MTHQLTLWCIFRNEECLAGFPWAAVGRGPPDPAAVASPAAVCEIDSWKCVVALGLSVGLHSTGSTPCVCPAERSRLRSSNYISPIFMV